MATYSYGACLERAYQVNWKISDVLGTVAFDLGRPWLPAALSGAGGIHCLDANEKRKLTHVEMGAYAHLFGFVEAFIAPEVLALARDMEFTDEAAFAALTNFASEEVKHMHLFRIIRRQVDELLGFRLELLGGHQEAAAGILARNRGAVLLLTSAIEWFTQQHYLSAMKDSETLDPLTKEIFRSHWLEEAQHAKLDHLEIQRVFQEMDEAGRAEAVDDLIWLLAAVDGLLQKQAVHDVANLQTYLGRRFTDGEREEIRRNLLKAKRHCFIESGVTHPNFQEIFLSVTTADQQDRVRRALEMVLQGAA